MIKYVWHQKILFNFIIRVPYALMRSDLVMINLFYSTDRGREIQFVFLFKKQSFG